MANVAELGTFRCACCCSNERKEHTDEDCNPGYMRCSGCNCVRVRMGGASQLIFRVQVMGALTVTNLEKANELVRLLGGPDDVTLTREADAIHYFEVSAEGATAALEIGRLRRQPIS